MDWTPSKEVQKILWRYHFIINHLEDNGNYVQALLAALTI
jgi:hypothetical protein